ncbi:MAG: Mor transcription activator family protein [Methylobacter sp.]|nr:Mor transcription activator family protein [Methylobacter sp.]MDP2099127.1 Mor transcription activator family protein [Methylobacter sp.]MDP2429953.1 Mor transcription activator family protein [Methylobacter sp.]MDP3054798.1 Mor transcription activator family protein [Methylobacter sp.]MDP3361218.1 Mor transcription activator family protein [Methylobacter sp.]
MNELPENYPEKLTDMHERLRHELDKLKPKTSYEVAWCVTEMIRIHYSGTPLYFPKGDNYQKRQRDIEIYEKYNGKNTDELHKEYGVTVKQIYSIIKRVNTEKAQARPCA